jgi:hypothetical protein
MSGAVFVGAFSVSVVASEDFPEIGNLDRNATFLPEGGGWMDQMTLPGNVQQFSGPGQILTGRPTGALASVSLSEHQNITVSGSPGATVILSLKNFIMSDSSTFTLEGTATTTFVINVFRQFSLSGSAKILLAGDVRWNHVVFNVRGKGSIVKLSDQASLTGILNANNRTVKMTDQAIVHGQVHAKKLLLLGSSRIIEPVVSPEQPPSL